MPPEERLNRKNAFDASLVMGVEHFNRSTGRDRHRASLLKDLVDPQTGLIKKDLVRHRTCPICRDNNSNPLFVKDGFEHGRCPQCGLIYVNPVLRDDLVLEHYQDEASWVEVLESGPQVEMDRLKYAYGLDIARPYLHGTKVLDLGAGTGLFVRLASANGFETTALELHKENARRLSADGFRVVTQPLDQANLPEDHFDLVTLWEVLEHIVDPNILLNEIHRILKPKGVLLILVPNVEALVTRILHEKSGTFGGHSHVSFFNRRTLGRLLSETGFTMVEQETLITELGTINNYLSFEEPYLGRAPTVLDVLTPELIHEKLIGSKLLMLVTKN
jgi:2-polyprenyl-3-methyl-5-hydroxy-6-metoxy-1,4-benzoquinol methylase